MPAALLLTVLVPVACSPEDQQQLQPGQRAAAFASSLAAAASTSAGGHAGAVCGDALPTGGVEAIATRKLDSLGFAWRVRCIRRVAQRPETLRIDEIEEIVAWRDGNETDTQPLEALFVMVSHGPPSDTADARGVWPLSAILAALEAHWEDQDSVSRNVILTLGAVSAWDILDASAPDDTVRRTLDSEYRDFLEATADSGPSPPLARPRQPGILIGLISQSNLPVLSHDPRDRMVAEGSVFGHSAWHIPDRVSLRTSGDMLVLGVADGVSADDDTALSDFTDVVVRALKTADSWTDPKGLANSLLWDRRTISWLLGIVLPIVFLGVGTWCLLGRSLTNLGNARRALRYTDAEVVRHLLCWRRAAGRTRGRIVRSKRRFLRTSERIKRVERILEADDASARRKARATAALRKTKLRRDMLDGRLMELKRALNAALDESAVAEAALLEFGSDERHGRDSKKGARDDPGGVTPDGPADPNAAGSSDEDKVIRIKQVVSTTRATRLWLWVRRLWYRMRRVWRRGRTPAKPRPAEAHPRNRCPEFVDEMRRLASWLVCDRQHSGKIRDIQKKRGQDIVSGVWNGVWRAITKSRGAWAFAIGAVSVPAALVLTGGRGAACSTGIGSGLADGSASGAPAAGGR